MIHITLAPLHNCACVAQQMLPSRRRHRQSAARTQCSLLILLIAITIASTSAFIPTASLVVSRSSSNLYSSSPSGETPPPPQHLIDFQTFLKLTSLVSTGGDAKRRIQAGECKLNGEQEERRSKKLFSGDTVEVDGVVLDVRKEVMARGYVLKVAPPKLPKEQRPGYTAPTKEQEYSGEFRTAEWREERKAKKYARKMDNREQREGGDAGEEY
jgi:ribosome-associated protein